MSGPLVNLQICKDSCIVNGTRNLTNSSSQFLYNFTFEPVNVVYDNSGYSPTWDSNPYTVETKVNLKSTCEKLPYQMIVLR